MSGDLEDVPRTALGWAKEPITAGSHQLVLASGQWSAVRAYLASIHFVDRQIGRLIGARCQSARLFTCILLVGIMVGTWEKTALGQMDGLERVNASLSSSFLLKVVPLG